MDEIVTQTKFCHYTTVDNARKILSSEYIFLNKLSGMNDLDENELHKDENDQIFIVSFCHSEAKNIPLFYLYSGIDGQGCRIEFTASKMKGILADSKVYPVNDKCLRLKKPYKNDDYEIHAGWVHYIAKSGYHFYRGKENEKYADWETAIGTLSRTSEMYFIKNPIWKYESEFRIVIKLHKPVSYNRIALHLPIKQNESGISITCGPEMQKDIFSKLKTEFEEYGIRKIKPFSNDREIIKMGLIDRNADLYKRKNNINGNL